MGSNNVDQKKLFNKLKHDLEGYREIIVLINSVLKWDKKFYPGIIFTYITLCYIVLWYLDLSILTLISLGLLQCTIINYFLPILSKIAFKPDNWTGVEEKKFEEICDELCTIKMKLCSNYDYLFAAVEERSTMFFITVSAILVVCAWIGSVVNNLLLTYIIGLCLTFYPGLHHHGIIGTIKAKFGTALSSNLQHLKEKAFNKSE